MAERYVGFYTTPSFWAVEAITPEAIYQDEVNLELMRKIVFSYNEDLFQLRVCRDGKILLQISDLETDTPPVDGSDFQRMMSWWRMYLEYLNCVHLLLNSAVLEIMNLSYLEFYELTSRDVFRVEMSGDKIVGEVIAYMSIAATHQIESQFKPFTAMKLMFPVEVFEKLVENMSQVFSDYSLVSYLATVSKSVSEYKVGNYSISLVLAWFVVESLLATKWRALLESKNQVFSDESKRINSDRMSNLTEGRDYPISVVSNFLELSDKLEFKSFKEIDKVRGYRNKIVHQVSDFECTDVHCREAIDLALELLLYGKKIDVRLDYSRRLPGFIS